MSTKLVGIKLRRFESTIKPTVAAIAAPYCCAGSNMPSGLQEFLHGPEKSFELVVMDPMSGMFDQGDTRSLEMSETSVGGGVRCPAVRAVDEQGRTIDPGPKRV